MEPDSFAELIAGAEKRSGLLTIYVDDKEGKVLLEIPKQDAGARTVGDFLYVEGLTSGLGSNPVGLDRGQLGDSRLVTLRVLGGKLLIEEQNLRFRALSSSKAEANATRESFATSVLWTGKIEARASDGRALVDISSFLLRDAHGVAHRLRETEQGDYALDADRSVVATDHVLAFPDNLEFEAILTFKSDKPGSEVIATAPDATSFSVTQHHSLIRLPGPGYEPRRFDPRTGSFAIEFANYAAPLDESLIKRWIARHRLRKGEPLVYYVDPGVPEPVRTAVFDGARWWAKAFEEAGHPGMFRVELLPEDVHPLDVRYNVIQWVHRQTRGWSYGSAIVDPRTGEIIKGHVSLGSLRVRQDRLIFEGLLGSQETGSGTASDPVVLALARIRQLAAHEVGHTLGFAHNFVASTYGRESVMDYPAPLVAIADGALDVSAAYDVGIGDWDIQTTRYAYSEFAGDESAELDKLIAENRAKGFVFLPDRDARPAGAAHPLANLWDNGADPIASLENALAVRRLAMKNFGRRNARARAPLSELEEVFATVYFHHRYQLMATVKSVGGLLYENSIGADGLGVAPVAADLQRKALAGVLAAVAPAELDIPESTLEVLVPRTFGTARSREQFPSRTSPSFDALGAARAAADAAFAGLLQHERAARLIDQHRRDPSFPSLAEVIDTATAAAFSANATPREEEIRRETQRSLVGRLIDLAANNEASDGVRAEAERGLRSIAARLRGSGAHEAQLKSSIDRFLSRPNETFESAKPLAMPPGSPIGCSRGSTARR